MNSLITAVIPPSLDTNRDLAECLMAADTIGMPGNLPTEVDEFTVFPF